MFNFRLYSMHEKIYTISFTATFFGVLLPWIIILDDIVLGIETVPGPPIMLLMIISAIVSYYFRSKYKKVSIVNIILGILCFLIVLFSYLGYSIVVNDAVLGGLMLFGPGIYIAMLGAIGIVISGIVGLVRKEK